MFARTKRLILRPGWSEDAPALAAALGNDDVVRTMIHAPRPYDIDDAMQYLHRPRDPRLPDFLAFARTGGAPRLVGGCSVISRDSRLELGYWVARPFWGLGFATEAAEAVMRIARATHIGRVTSVHTRDNKASGNVLRKLGFRPTGRTEERVSAKRNTRFTCVEFEDAGDIPMSGDMASELYYDRAPIAA
jgi:RimJ/RimL family protein N-acetyltransferase